MSGLSSERLAPVNARPRPPSFRPPDQGRLVVILPWEYGYLPVDWVAPLNQVADEIWVPSTYVRESLAASGVDPGRVIVVPNGVDPERFHPGGAPANLPARASYRFLFVGGTLPRKGADLLVDAYCRAFKPSDDVCLVVKDFGRITMSGAW